MPTALPRSIFLTVRAGLPPNSLRLAFGLPGSDDEGLSDRLYSKGRVLGHKRAKRNSTPNTSLLQIEGVGSKDEAQFYLGKVRRFHHISRPTHPKFFFALLACSICLQG